FMTAAACSKRCFGEAGVALISGFRFPAQCAALSAPYSGTAHVGRDNEGHCATARSEADSIHDRRSLLEAMLRRGRSCFDLRVSFSGAMRCAYCALLRNVARWAQ
ncbi:MAG TPA: hypothetical protein VLF18_10870, partial [Tahibacter sp.]|uniref:hypothetical protein n=1 Tax=Tahibacter sp. TaxID=2056211 RepID=UPI002BF67EB5